MSQEKDHKETPEKRPIYGPELEIIPTEEKSNEEELEGERRVIGSILEDGKKLPWVHPSWQERGQA